MEQEAELFMRITCPVSLCMGFFLGAFVPVCWGQLPEVPEEAIEALGTTVGTPQSSGFVFIEGRYLAPPYTVTRKGNGIFINRIQVEQPFGWTAETLMPSAIVPPKRSADEPKKKELEKTSIFSDAPAQEAAAPATNELVAAEEKPATPPAGNTLDALFGEGTAKAAPEDKNEAPDDKKATPLILSQKQKDEFRQKLDTMRQRFEVGLAQGEIFLFNYKYGRINGTYGTAKTLFSVLPEAVRYSQSPRDLMTRLNQGGVYFLDINACTDLYRNKLNFMVLSDRRQAIEVTEATKNQLRPR